MKSNIKNAYFLTNSGCCESSQTRWKNNTNRSRAVFCKSYIEVIIAGQKLNEANLFIYLIYLLIVTVWNIIIAKRDSLSYFFFQSIYFYKYFWNDGPPCNLWSIITIYIYVYISPEERSNELYGKFFERAVSYGIPSISADIFFFSSM